MAATVAELLVKLGVRLDGSVKAEDGLRKLKKRAGEFGDSADSAAARAKKLASAVGKTLVTGIKVGAAAVAIYGAALGKLVLDKAETIDATNKLKDSLGIEIEEMQRLQFAASQSGASNEKLAMGIKFLNKGMLDLKNGGGKGLQEALGDLGLELRDLDKLSHTQQLGLIGDRLNEIEDPAERSAMAARVLGEEAGPGLATLLSAGTQGLEELTAAARGVVSQEDADRASSFQDRLGELKNTVEGLATGVAVDLIPAFEDIAQSAIAWFDANEDLISQGFAESLELVSEILKILASEVGVAFELLSALSKVFGSVTENSSVASKALAGVAEVVKVMMTPLKQLRTLAGEVAYLLENLGMISMSSADEFNRAIGNMEGSATGLDRISDKYLNLASAADQARLAIQMQREGVALYGDGFAGPLDPADQIAGKKKLAELDRERKALRARNRASNRAGRVAGASGKVKAVNPTAEPARTLTMEDLRRRLLTGDMSALRENVASLASSPASIADTKPSVVIHHTDNSVHTEVRVERVTVDVAGAGSPAATAAGVGRGIASELRRAILEDNARTARRIPSTVVR